MNLLATPARRRAFFGFLRWATIVTFIFTLACLGYYLYFNVLNLAPADVYVARRGTAVSAVYGTVTISASATISLYAQNTGYIHSAPGFNSVIESQGTAVKQDQLLAIVVDELGQRQLNQARTDYEAAVARQKTGPTTAGSLKSNEDQLTAYERLPPNSVPRVTLETTRNEVARLRGAVANEKLELQRAVDLAASAVKTYEDQVKRTEVRSPLEGIITLVAFNDNSYVLTNQALFTVATKATYVSGQVNEEDVGSLKEGMKAELRLYAFPSKSFTATLTAVLPSPDPNSSRYTVTLNLDNTPGNLKFGLTAEMNIIHGRKEDALIIPARAVNVDQVLIVEDNIVKQRTVKLGFKSLEYAEILDGVSDGDQVIVSDQEAFHTGERVRPAQINQAKPKRP